MQKSESEMVRFFVLKPFTNNVVRLKFQIASPDIVPHRDRNDVALMAFSGRGLVGGVGVG